MGGRKYVNEGGTERISKHNWSSLPATDLWRLAPRLLREGVREYGREVGREEVRERGSTGVREWERRREVRRERTYFRRYNHCSHNRTQIPIRHSYPQSHPTSDHT